jgi:hypothetical protein
LLRSTVKHSEKEAEWKFTTFIHLMNFLNKSVTSTMYAITDIGRQNLVPNDRTIVKLNLRKEQPVGT